VVFIHGIISTAQMWQPTTPGSIAYQAARIRGVTAWTFNYQAESLDWVTNPAIGPAIARSLACLASSAEHNVIVVAHSMGGLATQYALAQPDPGGGAIASHVAEVITVGTPYQGSELLTAMQQARQGLDLSPAAVLGEAVLSACAGRTSGICALPAVMPAQVGTALELNSPAIAQLPPWPAGLPVLDVAGDMGLLIGVGPFVLHRFDIGDVAVTVGSATAHNSTGQPVIKHCNSLRLLAAIYGNPGPCFHTHLVNDGDIITDILTAIHSQLTLAPAAAAAQLSRLTPGMHNTLVAISGGFEAAVWDEKGHVTFWKLTDPSQTWKQIGASTYPVLPTEPPGTTLTGALLAGMSDATFIADGPFSGDGTGNAIAFTNGARGWGTIAPGPGNTLIATGNRSTDNATPGNSYSEYFHDGDLSTSEPGSLPFGPNGEEWQIERTYKWTGGEFQQISASQFTAAKANPLPASAPPFPAGHCNGGMSGTYKDFYVSASTTFTTAPRSAYLPASVVLRIQADSPAAGCTFTVAPNFPIVISAATPSGTIWITAPAWVLTHGVNGNQDIGDLLPGTQFPGQVGLNSLYFQDPEFSPYYIPKNLGITQIGQLAAPVASIHDGTLTALTILQS
jgi:pimeloyl-ACP methyl ester carboxylesterase